MDDVIMQLLLLMDNLQVDETEHHLAAQLLKNIYEIPDLSIENMAERCYTSPATLSRFIKRLGFKSYVIFRNTFGPEINNIKTDRKVFVGYNGLPETTPIERFIGQLIDSLTEIQQTLDPEELNIAVQTIHDADNVIIMESSDMLPAIIDFQYRMLLCERFVQFSPSWVHASEMSPNSVRILPEVVSTRGESSGCRVRLRTVERLNSYNGSLFDIHISIQETIPFVTTNRSRFSNDEQLGRIALMCALGIIHSAYSERYISDFAK